MVGIVAYLEKRLNMNRTKRIIIAAGSLLFALMVLAAPAKKLWQTVNLNGTMAEVALVGDENLHYYVTRDGRKVVTDDGITFRLSTSAEFRKAVRRQRTISPKIRRTAKSAAMSAFVGAKYAPVILVDFPDKSFVEDSAGINRFTADMLNMRGYRENGAIGSVRDYFADMSRGRFDLSFDVIGPVTVGRLSTYYGGTDPYWGGTDYIGEFMDDAIHKADSLYDVDWTKYDWNSDGEVEQVFVLYAGYGMATQGPVGTIWPHAWTLDEAKADGTGGNGSITFDGVRINQYACSNELYGSRGQTKMGIGTFCHEFSHCLGLPDVYDTNNGNNITMGTFDLLDEGNYNGPNGHGWVPPVWTSWERATVGWLEPIVLHPNDSIRGMQPMTSEYPEAYTIVNDAHPDEYYLLENRQQSGWDSYIPESGLLVIHVDYDSTLFVNNIVNAVGDFNENDGYSGNFHNDHLRMTPFNKRDSRMSWTYNITYPMPGQDAVLDSLTDNSTPAAMLYNTGVDGSWFMHKPVYDIKKADDGTVSFVFMPQKQTDGICSTVLPLAGDDEYTQYYNMNGQLVAHPHNGIFIRRTAQEARKVVVR